ncbi:hypothetical protein CK203_101442 [Vitis vinifera]|uniref:Uncharacterized protein n=1 Tax=Vitis vinifera TaxID=29760 RepID=A0A438BRE2_VITVI|nr:hypothetical protein CK203_101442 [Vitis vinifera]
MKFFLQMQGERVWNAVEYVWEPPLILDVHGRSTGELNLNKIRAKSITNGVNPMLGALFIILNGVCLYEFHKIANCARAKEACGILQVTHEGDKSFFTSLEDYNGRTVTFGDGRLACVERQGSISTPGCPKVDGVLYLDGLKAKFLSAFALIASRTHPLPTTVAFGAASSARSTDRIY